MNDAIHEPYYRARIAGLATKQVINNFLDSYASKVIAGFSYLYVRALKKRLVKGKLLKELDDSYVVTETDNQ